MANFEDILNKPASDVKPPPAYPIGTYLCLVDGPPLREESSQKKTPCRTYRFKIMSPMPDVNATEAAEQQIVGKMIQGQGAGTAFYITEDALWRYKEFLSDCLGIEEGTKSIREMEAEAPGRQVLVKLIHQMSQDGKRNYHKVDGFARP